MDISSPPPSAHGDFSQTFCILIKWCLASCRSFSGFWKCQYINQRTFCIPFSFYSRKVNHLAQCSLIFVQESSQLPIKGEIIAMFFRISKTYLENMLGGKKSPHKTA